MAVTAGGEPFEAGEIRSDADEHPDILAVGDIRLILLKRGARFALRIKDNQSAARARSPACGGTPSTRTGGSRRSLSPPIADQDHFRHDRRRAETCESPGYVVFERDGKTYRLQAATESDGSLWFVFRDGTSGRTTHGGARQLTVDPPAG